MADRAVPALAVHSLSKRYSGGKVALGGVDVEVAPGQLVGLLGPNGAGKSTLTKILCGLVRPSAGEAFVGGEPAGSLSARETIGYLAELFRFPGWLSAEELLELHQRIAGSSGGQRERHELLDRVGLGEARDVRVAEMSKGMQQRLGIGQALIGSPRLLLLDEPTSALDPAGRRVVRELLLELRARGTAVLLNSHLLGEVERICDTVTILDHGQVVASGSAGDLGGKRGVEVETGSGVRRYEGVGREGVPAVIRELVESGESVYAARETGSSLEDAYLEAVAGADAAGETSPEREGPR